MSYVAVMLRLPRPFRSCRLVPSTSFFQLWLTPVPALPQVVLLLITSCSANAAEPDRKLVTPPIPAQSADVFEDVTHKAGIDFVHQFCHERIANILLSNGSGVVVFDYDNDGFPDLYFLNWGPLEGVTSRSNTSKREPNRLYRNRGDGTFEDTTAKAGLQAAGFGSSGATGDYDNDGYADLFVVNVGRSMLFHNRGNGTFEDVTDRSGVGHAGAGISAVFLDYDHDGLLDLFLANYLTYAAEKESEQNPGAYPGPLAYKGEPNVLYRNLGNGKFQDVTKEAGLYATGHRAMSVCAFDCNRDGWTDLYVSNDDTPNMLWLNDGKGHFRDIAMEAGAAFNSIGEAPGSMNATVADVNGDGLPDLFLTRFGYGSLYVRNAQGLYDDRMWASNLGPLTQKHVGWGGAFLDFDNDGDADLLIANGDAFKLQGTVPLLLENDGKGGFTDAAAKGGAVFKQVFNGRGNAIVDFDNDGRLDVVLTALADRPFLLKNRSQSRNHWLKLNLQGTKSNRSGYGTLLTVTAGDLSLRGEAICPTGFLSQGDPRPHFGLGNRSKVDRLELRWPSGVTQVITNINADQILKVTEPNS